MKFKKIDFTGKISTILWTTVILSAVGLLFARMVFSDISWLTVVLSVFLVFGLAGLIRENRKALTGRKAAYGLNTFITTVLVIAIISVLNFVIARHPLKLDLTRNQIHSLSDQTTKVVKGLKTEIKATLFANGKPREDARPLLENLKGLNPKFEVELVDPNREPTRAKQAGIKANGTLILSAQGRESKIDAVSEEKITNALIKLLKPKAQTLCSLTGHGEKSFNSNEADGYSTAKKGLSDQFFEIKDINVLQEGKIPDTCDTIAILGATKSFFDAEIKAIQTYLDNGGRAIIAADINIKGSPFAPELMPVLKEWHVAPVPALIVDQLSSMVGGDATIPILATYSKENPITKDFQANCFFPFSQPLEILPNPPVGLNVQWLAKTSPKSWGEMDFKELATGQVKFDNGQDRQGPLVIAAAVEGKKKDSKASKNTRLVVFGTSYFATNNYSRYGGNLDFFLNAASWALEDESFIAIRSKEEGAGTIELSQRASNFIKLVTIFLLPLFISLAGIVIWRSRKKL